MEKKESNHFALDKVWESCWLWTKLRNWAICWICAAAGKKKSGDVAPPRGRWRKPLLRLLSTAFPTSLKIHSSLTARAWRQMRRRRPLLWSPVAAESTACVSNTVPAAINKGYIRDTYSAPESLDHCWSFSQQTSTLFRGILLLSFLTHPASLQQCSVSTTSSILTS